MFGATFKIDYLGTVDLDTVEYEKLKKWALGK